MKSWDYSTSEWPPSFGRLWLWTMFSERANQDRVVEIAKEIGATDVVVLINNTPSHSPSFKILPNVDMTVELSKKIRAAGIRYHICSWLDPKENYVNDAAPKLADLARLTGASSVCIDAEGEWRKRISNHLQFVSDIVHPAFAGFPVPIGVTSFAALPKEVAPLLAWAVSEHKGYGMPQAYAVDTGAAWQKAATVQPDTISALAWRKWSTLTKNLVPIVAAYGKTQPGWNIRTALEAQLLRSAYEGFPEVSVWVEESLVGKGQTATTRRAVLSELNITGQSTVVGRSIWKPLLGVSLATTALALTRRTWIPPLKSAWRWLSGE